MNLTCLVLMGSDNSSDPSVMSSNNSMLKNSATDTIPMLNYSVPLKGVSEPMKIFINRSLRNFSGKSGLTWPGMLK